MRQRTSHRRSTQRQDAQQSDSPLNTSRKARNLSLLVSVIAAVATLYFRAPALSSTNRKEQQETQEGAPPMRRRAEAENNSTEKRNDLPDVEHAPIPSCAKNIHVDLLDSEEHFLCHGLLLRDDLVLSSRDCSRSARTVKVRIGGGAMARRKIVSAEESLTIDDRRPYEWTSLIKLKLPPFHYFSGWPRNRMILNDDVNLVANASSSILAGGEQGTFHVYCHGNYPLLSVSSYSKDRTLQPIENLTRASGELSEMPRFRNDDFADMINDLGERWWVKKTSREALVDLLFSRKSSYVGPNGTLDIVSALGDRGVLEAEDPKGARPKARLWRAYGYWTSKGLFSGEPFFEWLDHGSGRKYRQYASMYKCKTLSDVERNKTAIQFEISQTGNVTVVYKETALPVEMGDMLFVWGLNNVVYVARSRGKRFHHIGFFGAKPVLMSGEFTLMHNGSLSQVIPQSGHYRPHGIHIRRFYRYLKSLGMSSSAVLWRQFPVDELMNLTIPEWQTFLDTA